MSKNRKKTNKKRPFTDAGFSAYCEEQFLITAKALRKLTNPKNTAAIGQDFTHEFRKRRIDALERTLKETDTRIAPICEGYNKAFPWKENWGYVNALPTVNYDLLDGSGHLMLGAVVWMLDQYKASGRLEEVIGLLPPSDSIDQDLADWMPELWDASYSSDLLTMLRQILIQRNRDCEPPVKESGVSVRAFMDAHTLAGTHHQEVPSRRLFEELLSLLPENAVNEAKGRYISAFWEWTERFFRTRLVYAVKEEELEQKVDRLDRQIKAAEQELNAKKNLLQAHRKKPLFMPSSHDPLGLMKTKHDDWNADFQRLDTLYVEFNRRVRQQEELGDEMGQALLHLGQYVSKGAEAMKTNGMPPELFPIWTDFHIDDPYALCFGFLALLDEGSDLPWLYYPSVGLMSCVAAALPWCHLDYEKDEEEKEKAVSPLETLDAVTLNHLQYADEDDDLPPEPRNLSQVVYRLSGILLPRRFDCLAGNKEELEQLGVTEEREQTLLLTAMSLLTEVKNRADLPVAVAEIEELEETEEVEPTEDIEALRERISLLKKENERLKSTAYEASRSLRDARKQAEEREKAHELERQELADLRELVFTLQERHEEPEEAADETITFPCATSHRIVSFGGHDSWAREIRKKLPNVRFVDRDQLPNSETIRRADFIFIQSNSLSHAYFYRIIEEARRYSVPVRYFSYASAVKCAEQLVKADKEFVE